MKKKNIIAIIMILFLFLIIGGLSSLFIIKPSIDKIIKSSEIKILTDKEKTDQIKIINDKYEVLLTSLDNNYSEKYKKIDEKYISNYKELDDKYILLNQELENKYNKIEQDIKAKYDGLIADVNAKYKLPMTHPSWYEYSVKAMNETSDLRSKMYDEIREKTSGKTSELLRNNSNKRNEESLLDEQKENEINLLDDSKENEKELLIKNKNNEINDVENRDNNKSNIISKAITNIIMGLIIIIIYILYLVVTYNKLTKLKNKVKESWSGIEVLLKRRSDLIPNFVKTVKGYAKHEKDTFKEITNARKMYDNAKNKNEEIDASINLSSCLSKLIILSENYPDLKANENFLSLQDELKNTEDLLARSRISYNKSVLKYKNKLEKFPSNIVASAFKFSSESFYDIDEREKENVNV